MVRDYSEIYIGETESGKIVTVAEYARQLDSLRSIPTLVCPECKKQRGEHQPLEFDQENNRFLHQNQDITRACYRDERASREHQEAQQAVYAVISNDPAFEGVEQEYPLSKNFYDVGALTPKEEQLEGVVFEVQHSCGNFKQRIDRKIRTAHNNDYAIQIVFTESATGKSVEERLDTQVSQGYTAGSYSHDTVRLGTVIRPKA